MSNSANIGGYFKRQEEVVSCPDPMTRAALLALRNAGDLRKDCHYTITDASVDGTLDVQEIVLHAVNENTLSQQAGILTSHDNTAWQGVYDIDQDDVLEVTDNLENTVISNDAILIFPWGNTSVTDNHVSDGRLVYNGGTVDGNIIDANANVTVNGGTFTNNHVATDANVTANGLVVRNHFEAQSNTTISSGDFRENRVQSDATVNSSTSGDVDNNHFSSLSVSNISGAANVDTVTIKQNANLTISGGNLSDTSIQEDAQVTIISGSNYENVFGASTIYNQVGTGYIRYSTIEGTTTWTNGNTNVSNVHSYVSTVNTTGSTGVINNSILNRAYMVNARNVPSLTITDCTISNYAQVSITGAARFYFYRSTATDGSRILISAGSRIDASYTHLNSYAYLQSNQSGGFLRANYCNLSSLGYISNQTVNTNYVERTEITSQSNIRFLGTSANCRMYYCSIEGGSTMYHNNSTGCYIYYSSAIGNSQIYTQGSTDARIYYSSAQARSFVRSLNNAAVHYLYYCNAESSGYVQMNNAGGRMYSVSATSQSIVEKRGAGGNIYYSTFTAYYYAYITRASGTSSGLFGQGRRTNTITNPVGIAPYAVGSSWQNF